MKRTQEFVEIFHLLLLRHLEDKLDKNLYALKGGCNLRFYFKSIRYSEDIDFDICPIALQTLRNKINKLLASVAFKQNLKSYGIQIIKISVPKQTETTQRWKLSLQVTGISLPIATKIEFSRRAMSDDVKFAPVDNSLIQAYKLYPILSNHYSIDAAFNQKIDALMNRTETQARDIFDLNLLLDQGVDLKKIDPKLCNHIHVAIENLNSIDFAAFKGQVVAYLLSEYQVVYSDEKVWSDIKNKILLVLEGLQNASD